MKKIELSYQKNVRDIGGFVGYNGKKVKEGRIYRGGFLGRLSKKDVDTISKLNLTDIIDFRSAVEFENRPDYKFPNVTYHSFPSLIDNPELKKKFDYDDSNLLWFLGGNYDAFHHMELTYEENLTSEIGIEAMKNLFKVMLSDDSRTVYFHCSQGKDRAGLASYLILYILGVDEKEIREDYLRSNEAMKQKIKQLKFLLKDKPFYSKDYEKALKLVFSADERYLDYGLNSINKKFGSLDFYIKNILEVDIDKFREYYLE